MLSSGWWWSDEVGFTAVGLASTFFSSSVSSFNGVREIVVTLPRGEFLGVAEEVEVVVVVVVIVAVVVVVVVVAAIVVVVVVAVVVVALDLGDDLVCEVTALDLGDGVALDLGDDDLFFGFSTDDLGDDDLFFGLSTDGVALDLGEDDLFFGVIGFSTEDLLFGVIGFSTDDLFFGLVGFDPELRFDEDPPPPPWLEVGEVGGEVPTDSKLNPPGGKANFMFGLDLEEDDFLLGV